MISSNSPRSRRGRGGVPRGRLTFAVAYLTPLAVASLLATGVLLALGASSASAAEPCPNEAIREQQSSTALPDCRAYEQVSPTNKSLADVIGAVTSVRAAPSGEAITFDSLVPYPPAGQAWSEGSSQLFTPYLSARDSATPVWSTEDLEPPLDADAFAEPLGVTEDLSQTLIFSQNLPPLLQSPEVIEGASAVYLRDDRTGSYRLLIQLQPGEGLSFFFVAAADHDSRIFFESKDPLLPTAPLGSRNLYEWHEGQLSLINVLPEGLPADGGAAGWRGPGAVEEGVILPDHSTGALSYFVQNAVAQDGSRVFFTDLGIERLYMREPQAERTVAVSAGPAQWRAATSDGSAAFYTEAGALWRFDATDATSEELIGGEAAHVQGVLGVSADGSSVYFADTAALASGAVPGAGNIYLWHEDSAHETTIALVSSSGEEDDWTAHDLLFKVAARAGPAEGVKTARLSADGRTLLFTSRGDVTGYDNNGAENNCEEEERAAPCDEIYLYQAGEAPQAGHLSCVSCNPRAAATSDALLYHRQDLGFALPPELYPWDLPRNLSEDGARVFFDTEEALLSADTNGQMDVYEWEAPGTGSCNESSQTYRQASAGCLYLISTGQSDEPSYFADASATGTDAFLFTRQPLLGQDDDALVDLYDARLGGGFAAQAQPPPKSPCQAEEACRQAPASPPSSLSSATTHFQAGPESPPAPCKKGFLKKRGHCVKRHRKASGPHTHAERSPHANHGAVR